MDTTQIIARRKLRLKPLGACLVLPLAIGGVECTSVFAATLQVQNCNDAGSGSLRDAVESAHSGDTIDLRSLVCSSISLTSDELMIGVDDLILQGPGSGKLTIAAESQVHHSVFLHRGKGTLRVDSLRITRGLASVFDAPLACISSTGTCRSTSRS